MSWEGLVTNPQCADDYVVKYWPRLTPNNYQLSSTTLENEIVLEVSPRVEYQIQAVAREDKGGQLITIRYV